MSLENELYRCVFCAGWHEEGSDCPVHRTYPLYPPQFGAIDQEKLARELRQEEVMAKLVRDFAYRAERPVECGVVRAAGLDLAQAIAIYCPAGPEREEALKKVREAVMWAAAAAAKEGK